MLLVNPWRMPILWLISGIAIRFVLVKVSLASFVVGRSKRLLLPFTVWNYRDRSSTTLL